MKFSHLLTPLLILTIVYSSCKKPDNPQPVEEELITTLKLFITDSIQTKVFQYKVENGFGSGTQLTVDTIILPAGRGFTTRVELWNEKASPVEEITPEIIDEKEDHLLIWQSQPASGAGSLIFSGGSLDNNGEPFNNSGYLTTGTSGTGKLTITLKHLPTNKKATHPASAGGSTDAEAVFPVVIY